MDNIELDVFNSPIQYSFIQNIAPRVIDFYIVVIFFKCMVIFKHWIRFKKLCHSAFIKPSLELQLFTSKKAREFGLSRKINLWYSDAVSTPLTFGFLRPVILMPVALINHLNIKEAESLIIHELSHIKNNDYLLNWLLIVAETFFFFNPFVRIIAGKIKFEREKNCDVQVLQCQYPAIYYAETLLKAAKFRTAINLFPLNAVFKNSQLLRRIHFFTSVQNPAFGKRKYSTVSFPAIVVVLVISLLLITQIENRSLQKNAIHAGLPHFSKLEHIDKERLVQSGILYLNAEAGLATKKKLFDHDLNLKLHPGRKSKSMETGMKLRGKSATKVTDPKATYVMQVASEQAEEKDLIVKEESSGTDQTVTTAYRIIFKNGKWKRQLVYILKEKPPVKMDGWYSIKDSVLTYIPVMQ